MCNTHPIASDQVGAPRSDEDVRRRVVEELSTSFIVQAPAGSGKTELLVTRYLHLLSAVEDPEQILAITFTRKAASEMRSRVLDALQDAEAGDDTEDSRTLRRRQVAWKALARDRARHWNLLRHPDRLRIQTMDSFHSGLTSALPILSGLGGPPRIEERPETLYQEAVVEALFGTDRSREEILAARELLLHLGNHSDAAITLLSNLLANRDQWEHALDADLGDTVDREFLLLTARILDDIGTHLPAGFLEETVALLTYAASRVPDREEWDFARVPGWRPTLPTVHTLREWKSIARFWLTTSHEWRRRVDKNVGFPTKQDGGSEETKRRMVETLKRFSEETSPAHLARLFVLPDTPLSKEHHRILSSLSLVLSCTLRHLSLVFARGGTCDFLAVAEAAHGALGNLDDPTDVALAMEHQIQHILVDEFQDTSLTQFQLIRTLLEGWSEGDGHSLFLVGDPMQSIYRFRQAQVGLFLQIMQTRRFGDASVAVEPVHLNRNFRSHDGIVRWVNETFSSIFPYTDTDGEAVGYTPTQSAKRWTESMNTDPPLLMAFDYGEGEGTELPDRNWARKAEIVAIVRTLRTWQEDADIESVAVLVRKRSHAADLLPALREEGIPFNAEDVEYMDERQEILDVHALTRALLHPADRIAWLSLLRAPWCGFDLGVMSGWLDEPGSESIPERIGAFLDDLTRPEHLRKRLARLWALLAPRIDMVDRIPLRFLVQGLWAELGGPEYLDAQERGHVETYLDFLETLPRPVRRLDPAQLDALLSENRTSHADPGAKITVMTIHKAKGLEFDAVVLPRVDGRTQHDSPLLVWDRALADHGRVGTLFAVRPRRGEENAHYEWVRSRLATKQDHEIARLLYVAITRAAKRVLVTGCFAVGKDGVRMRGKGSFSSFLPPTVTYVSGVEEGVDHETSALPVEADLRRIPLAVLEGESMATPVRVSRSVPEARAEEEEEGQDRFTLEPARIAGIVVHRLLETLVRRGGATRLPEILTTLRPVIQQACMREGLVGDELGRAEYLVSTCLARMSESERGQWILRSRGSEDVELALTGSTAEGFRESIIDRTFVEEDGTRWIIDYKTADPGKAEIDIFVRDQEFKYRDQLMRYRDLFLALEPDRPVRTALYFPMIDIMREILP